MITIGGIGNNAGSLIGVVFGVGVLKLISTFNMFYGSVIASSGRASLFLVFENMALSLLLLLFLVFKPRGLIPEKRLYIPKIDYKNLVKEGSTNPRDGSEIAS
jgi:ABC-type branched-subunit amino acid transport system permease subunit